MLAVLLIAHPCSTRKTEKIDWQFGFEFFKSYFCTGDQDWWKNIKTDLVLGYMMHVGVIMFCQPAGFKDWSTLGELAEEARFAIEKHTWKKRTEVSNCMWDGIRDWHVVPFFCPLPSDIFMKNYDETLDFALESFCTNTNGISVNSLINCKVAEIILKEKAVIREVMKPYLCASNRLKRQFDVKSLMDIFKQNACLESVDFNFNYVAIEEGNHWHFGTFGFWCCIIEFVET